MLLRLLSILSDANRVASTSEIARQLGTGEGLVMRMIEDATRLGYLSALKGDCSASACSACGTRNSCSLSSGAGVWMLTEKGRRVLAGKPSGR